MQHIQIRQVGGIPFFDNQITGFSNTRELIDQLGTRTGFTSNINQFKFRMRNTKAQCLAAAIAGNTNDTNSNTHRRGLSI